MPKPVEVSLPNQCGVCQARFTDNQYTRHQQEGCKNTQTGQIAVQVRVR
jgi:hypothetical protein